MKKRVLSVLLAIVMVVGMFPVTAGALPAPHTHPVCGATHSDIGDHTGTCENVDWTAWDGTTDFPDGNVYLSADVTLEKTLEISSGTVNLCLNGKVLRISENATIGAVIEVSEGAELNLCDCQNTEHKFTPDGNELWGLDEENGTKSVSGGVITGGNTTIGSAIYSSGALRIYGGNIAGNHATSRAVVYSSGPVFSMYGGSICGNTGDEGNYGVGLCLWKNEGKHQIRGGKIYENKTVAYDSPEGVGVYVSQGNLTISGAVEIYGNKRGTENDNIYVAWNRSSENEYSLIIDGELTNTTPIGVWARYEDIIIKADGTNVTDLTEYMDHFTPDNTGRELQLSFDKKNIKLLSPHSHCVCGGSVTVGGHTHDSTAPTWEAWDGTDKDGETDGIQLAAGSWYLSGNVKVTSTVNIVGMVNLCLNGYSIENSTGSTIQVNSGATLNLCDCQTNAGSISATNNNADITGIDNSGTVNVYGGNVKATKSGNLGSSIGIKSAGTDINIYGGEINSSGTGIYNVSGTLTVSGGTVHGVNTGIGTNSNITISGSPSITGGCDIALYFNSKIIIGGALTYTEDKAISVGGGSSGTFTSGWTDKMGEAADYSKYFTGFEGYPYIVQKNSSGELELAAPATYTVTYDADGATSGTVPTDGNSYTSGSTVTVLGNTGALAKTGYAFVGWNTNSGGYGTDRAPEDTFVITANTTLYAQWEEYEITTQPTESTPAVSTNADGDIASYQWYKGTMSDVTDAAAGVSAYTEDALTSSYSDGWWTCHSTVETTPGYFTIVLSAGDSILAQTSAVINEGEGQLGIWADYEKQDWDWTTPDDRFMVTAPADGNYDLHVSDVTYSGATQPTVKAQVFHIDSTPADGATGKTLVAAENGWYACKITYADGTVLYSGPVEYEAPAPATYTVTYLPGAGGTGSEANDTKTERVDLALRGEIFTRTGYTQTGWATADGGEKVYELNGTYSDDAPVSLYPVWTANTYAVTLNTNGATIADGKNITGYTYGVGATLPAAGDMTKTSHRFDGWYASADFSDEPVTEISDTDTGDKTYYAKWTEVHTITGVVKDSDDAGIDGVTVKLMQGDKQFGENQTTSDGGQFSFTSVPLGSYNVVAVQDQKTKTELVIIAHTDETLTIVMPGQNVSSTLTVSGDSTPDVVVGGLDDEAADQTHSNAADQNTHISIGMSIESKEDVTDGGGSSEEATQQAAIKQAASAQQLDKVEFLSITVTKTVTTNGNSDGGTELEQTQTVLELIIPYSLTGKYNIGIYRHHDGRAEAFAALDSKPDEQAKRDKTFWIDEGNELIHIYTNRFSNYAIAYSDEPVVTPAPDPAPPVGDYTPTYAITVGNAENGEVKANRSYAAGGTTVTITVTPEDGYALDELTVTDSRGNKIELTDKGDGTFTFKMPSRKVSVEASFVDDGSLSVCPQDHTCPIWPYTDAETTAWYHDGVHYCIENGLMIGCGNGIFKPNADTTRAMITVMLWRLNGSPVVNYLLDFEDVEEGQWYTEAIRWAKSEGIAIGYGNGCFGTNDAITREQMVTILWRYARYKGIDVSVGENTNILSYNDAFDVAEYAIPAMQWACGSGMVQGINDPNGEGMILAPESKGARAQIATMMMRFCTEIVQK